MVGSRQSWEPAACAAPQNLSRHSSEALALSQLRGGVHFSAWRSACNCFCAAASLAVAWLALPRQKDTLHHATWPPPWQLPPRVLLLLPESIGFPLVTTSHCSPASSASSRVASRNFSSCMAHRKVWQNLALTTRQRSKWPACCTAPVAQRCWTEAAGTAPTPAWLPDRHRRALELCIESRAAAHCSFCSL